MAERKVLIIDDDEPLLNVLRSAFQRYKFRVLVARDGGEGIEMARQHVPDLVLLSVELPTGNGFLVCKDFKQDAKLKAIPIILTSRKATEADFEKHRKLKVRADDYLHKPFTDEELFQKVGNVVGFSLSPDEYTQLEAKVHDFLEERTKLEAEINEKNDRIARLEAELAATKGGRSGESTLKARVGALEAELSQKEAQFASEVGELQAQNSRLSKQLGSLMEENQRAEQEIARMRESMANLEATIATLRNERDAAVARAKELEAALRAANAEIGELTRLKAALAQAEGERDRLQTEVLDAQTQVQELQRAIERESKKRHKLKEVLEKAVATLD